MRRKVDVQNEHQMSQDRMKRPVYKVIKDFFQVPAPFKLSEFE